MARLHVLVVNGYGCHLDTPLGLTYLPRVAGFIKEREPDWIIFCGGQTQRRTAPGISEALVMSRWITSELGAAVADRFILESDSYSTFENIRDAASAILRKIGTAKIKVTIFCEAIRAPNVVMLARHFMGNLVESIDDITVETASWERADPFKQVRKMIFYKLAFYFPYLAGLERKKRLKRAEQI